MKFSKGGERERATCRPCRQIRRTNRRGDGSDGGSERENLQHEREKLLPQVSEILWRGGKKGGWGWGEMAFGGTDLRIRAQQRDVLIRRFEQKRNGLDSRRTRQTFLKITPGFHLSVA